MKFTDEESLRQYILNNVKNDIAVCEDYAESVIKPRMRERYDMYYASEEYYNKKFPILSKKSKLVDTSVADTIEWAIPALIKLFFGADSPVIITGVGKNDDKAAKAMNDLIQYQISRKNNAFLVFYNWFKDALLGFGVLKCLWVRETDQLPRKENMSMDAYIALTNSPSVQVLDVQPVDMFGNVDVSYIETIYKKNYPKIENILISEFLFPPNTKNIEDAPFVAHKKRVTMSYLYQKAKDGVYANVDKIEAKPDVDYDEIEQDLNDDYSGMNYTNDLDKARTEVLLYECYTKLDLDGDGILEDLIVTICEDNILRVEKNPFGRHPFFLLSPVKDPHRVFSKRGIPEMVGQLQDLKTALIRQIIVNIGLTNDPRLIMSEESINIKDYIDGKQVIRKKSGYPMADTVMSMPTVPLHPWTMQFLEYVEGQKEARTGITRYNQGLDGSSLNKTATGISAIMNASNQRLDLIARMFKETGIRDLYRFLIALNQKFVDQQVTIRVTDRELVITPDDLNGEIDLDINSNSGVAAKEQTCMYLQTIMTAILQLAQGGIQVATPTNFYNLIKRWIDESGLKSGGDYITDPAIIQQRSIIEMQMRSEMLRALPFEIQQEYMRTGMINPAFLATLPSNIQQVLVGDTLGQGNIGKAQGSGISGEFGGAGAGISGGLGTGVQGTDNRKSAPLQPSGASAISSNPFSSPVPQGQNQF